MKITSRFREPSTYGALGGFLALLSVNLNDEIMTQIAQVGACLFFFLGILLKEKGRYY
jgi:hypothetical protein